MLLRFGLLALIAFTSACSADRTGLQQLGDGGTERDAASALDGGTDGDAGREDAGGRDAGLDAGTDAGRDAGTDAGLDSGTDAGLDAGTDAGLDAGTDAGSDSGTDAGTGDTDAVCTERFGSAPEFELCSSAPDRCEIYVRFAMPDMNCSAVCMRRGGTCLESFDNGLTECMRGPSFGCGGMPFDRICVCSL